MKPTGTIIHKTSPVWQPFTQMKTADPPLKVMSASGCYLYLEDGRQILDCISSWWVNVHGHCQKEIADAIYEQAKTLEHVIFAGFTHEPAERLARELLGTLPEHLTRVFFSDNGSTAIEVALKMAYQYWRNVGEPQRTLFVGFDGGYHGDTVGAMSIGGSSLFWKNFQSLLFEIQTVSYPAIGQQAVSIEDAEKQTLLELREIADRHQDRIAAIFIEPLVQGAGGMRMCRVEFLQKLQQFGRERNILLVYDEVMTGFGRTGSLYACSKSKTEPDILCLSKGISGGFLPLSVTIASERIYEAFLSDSLDQAFFHGHSYTANPIACAAACASLKLLMENPAPYEGMEEVHRRAFLEHLKDLPYLDNYRIMGTIAAMEVKTAETSSYFNSVGALLKRRFLDAGLLIRPLGNTIYLMPPYCTGAEQIDFIYQNIRTIVESL